MSILANSNAQGSSNNAITNSLRFQSASSQYLSRTPTTAGNQQKFTWSGWIKRGKLGASQALLTTSASLGSNAGVFELDFTASDALEVFVYSTPTTYGDVITTQVFRDPSAWYHIVVTVDTTQATAANRIIVYVNGVQVTSYSTATYPSQNFNCYLNGTTPTYLGGYTASGNPAPVFDGYLANVHFIDGLALTPSSFGATDPITGQWVATGYSGSYGTNGFYLPFSDGTSTATLGVDYSGNKNNWNLTNFTRSAGVSDCWMYDVPANNTGPGVNAFQPSSNYCVISPIDLFVNTSGSVTNSNLRFTSPVSSGVDSATTGTIGASSGSWYFEWVVTQGTSASATNAQLGVLQNHTNTGFGSYSCALNFYTNGTTSSTYKNGSAVQTGLTAITAGDTIGIAFDATNGTVQFYRNNVALGSQVTGLTAGTYVPYVYAQTEGSPGSTRWILNANFGQRSFAYTPPSGFKALCTANLPAPTIAKGNQYMDATLYTGDGTTNRAVVNAAGFAPDFVWVKSRSSAASHLLVDSVRGASAVVYSNSTIAEQTINPIASLNSNGFSVNQPNTGADSSNINAVTYVGWQWKAGSSTVTNTSGTISSQVRASTTAGFSIVTYTGTGANATVGHGLGVAPKMIICKNRTDVISWLIYHESIGATKYLEFNTSAAVTATPAWNNTAPTSSVFTVGTYTNNNGSGKNQVAYCFAEIAGYSKFGSYTGNGSTDGPFVYTGFRPKYVMIKRTDAAADWIVYDTSVGGNNQISNSLTPDGTGTETWTVADEIDLLSNGFKLRSTGGTGNASSGTYIYMAFAESPFNISNAR